MPLRGSTSSPASQDQRPAQKLGGLARERISVGLIVSGQLQCLERSLSSALLNQDDEAGKSRNTEGKRIEWSGPVEPGLQMLARLLPTVSVTHSSFPHQSADISSHIFLFPPTAGAEGGTSDVLRKVWSNPAVLIYPNNKRKQTASSSEFCPCAHLPNLAEPPGVNRCYRSKT